MIYFVVDSTFCVTKEYAEKNNVVVAELSTLLDGKTYGEIDSSKWNEFFEAVKNSKSFPKTTQPSPQAFADIYNGIFEKDASAQIITLTLSSSLSGTFNCAKIVASEVNEKNIAVIDSMQTGESSLLLLEELVSLRDEGLTFEQLIEKAKIIRENVFIQFVPTTLEYLKRGGRIGSISATIASVLNIKPILLFKNNVLKCHKKCLGMARAINEMVETLGKNIKKLYVCYIYESPYVQTVLDSVKKSLQIENVEVKGISPVVGAHIGLGAVGIAALENY